MNLDTSAFDASVRKMQQELQKLGAMAGKGVQAAATPGAPAGAAGEAFKQSAKANKGELEQKNRDELRNHERIGKTIADRENKLVNLKRLQQDLVKSSRDELEIREKILKVEDSIARLRSAQSPKSSGPTGNPGGTPPPGAPGSGGANPPGAPPGNPQPTPESPGLLKMMGGVTAAIALVNKAVDASLAVYRAYGEAPIRGSVNQGHAMAGTFGSELQNAYAGRSGVESAWIPEKLRSTQMANENVENLKTHDTMSIYGKVGAGMVGGAAIGSAFPVVGTAIGGAVGGALGFGSALMDGRQRNRMLSEVSPRFKQEYESSNAMEFANKYQESVDAEKKKNPLKTMALEGYQGDYMKNLDFQRSTGLNYSTFHGKGGFREKTIDAGFMDGMGMQMGSSILGTGGSTRSAQENSVLGLQMQRGMGLTNAGGILGKLSGSMGDAGATRDATLKILAEGTRLGLDSSQFREENRKFSETAAEVIARSGTTNGEGADAVVDRLGRFMSDKSIKGIEAGRGAYETYQGLTSATSGPTGAMRLSGMLKDAKLGQIPATDRAALMQMPAEQLTEDNPTVQDVAQRNNMSPKELISKMGKVNQGGIHRLARADQLQKELSDVVDSTGGGAISSNFALSPEIKNKFNEYRTLTGIENPELAANPKQQTAFAEGTLGTSSDAMDRKAKEAQIKTTLEYKNTGVAEDRTVQQNAEGSRIILESFQKMGPFIGASADSIRKFNEQLQHTVEIIGKMPEAQRNEAFSKLFPSLLSPKNQEQAGKSSR